MDEEDCVAMWDLSGGGALMGLHRSCLNVDVASLAIFAGVEYLMLKGSLDMSFASSGVCFIAYANSRNPNYIGSRKDSFAPSLRRGY